MAQRILVLKPSSFGDIVHLFPALTLLKQQFPEAVLDFMVNPEFVPLLEFSPFPVERVILFERRKLGKISTFFPAFFRLISALRREKYDLVIDFQGLFRSGLCAKLSRTKCRIGFASPREKAAALFYDLKFDVARSHAVQRNVRLVESLCGMEKNSGVPVPELPVSASGRAGLPELPPRYMVLLPGTRWESKQFPPELFAAIIRRLREKMADMEFVVAGAPSEAVLGEAIGENVINLAGKTSLASLFELLRSSCGVLGNDSGPLHAAAALNVPVFGFYGPTVPGLTGPWGKHTTFFQRDDLKCAGCLKRNCPLEKTLCHQLDVDLIVKSVLDKLAECEK